MAQQVYDLTEGDFFYCIEAATGSQSPSANPEKWQRLSIPLDLVEAIASKAVAELLSHEGRADEAGTWFGKANAELRTRVNEAVQREGAARQLNVIFR